MQIHLQILNRDYTVTNSKYQSIQKWYKMETNFSRGGQFQFCETNISYFYQSTASQSTVVGFSTSTGPLIPNGPRDQFDMSI